MLPLLPLPILVSLSPILLAAPGSIDEANNAFSHDRKQTIFRVCQSPGCRDDGAVSTLEQLTALAPPCVEVIKGGCVSLCGSGPIVEICDKKDGVSSVKKKRVKGNSLVSLLDEFMSPPDEAEPVLSVYQRERLLHGYELSLKADKAFQSKSYQSAVELYEEAIQDGRKPALALQEARVSIEKDKEELESYPPGLIWLVKSFRNSCRSRIALGDIDGARRDAFAATVFSKNTDAGSHECLAEVCRLSGDVIGERQAVKSAMEQLEKVEHKYSQPMPGKDAVGRAAAAKIKSDAMARKRELGFRLAKLDRQIKAL